MRKTLVACVAIACLSVVGCTSAAKHRADVQADTDKLSVAKVQRDISIGMSGADVVAVLGSPNMITTDAQRREVWVYDKVSTEHAYSNSQGGLSIILAGIGGSTGASSTTQRTLTIIIKFDEKGTVRDYSYRQSSF